jgi:hypothetical protein
MGLLKQLMEKHDEMTFKKTAERRWAIECFATDRTTRICAASVISGVYTHNSQ